MAKAVITLSDLDSGELAMTIDYGAAFDVQSHAHQHVNLVLKAMDYLAKRKPDEQDCD